MAGKKRNKRATKQPEEGAGKKKQILAGHRRQGKKFIPPMMQLPGMKEVSYIDQGLPELVWIGLLSNQYGYHRGVELATELGKISFKHRGTDRHINFALASAFNALSPEARQQIVLDAEAAGILAPIRHAIAPLVALYEGCPLAFLGLPGDARDRDVLVGEIRTVVGSMFDKYKTPALVPLACVISIRMANGGCHFTNGVRPPDLNAIVDAPESEAAQHAGSSVRIYALNELMMTTEGRTSGWPKSFWNQGLVIDICRLLGDGVNEDG